jgi:hypothetical protein
VNKKKVEAETKAEDGSEASASASASASSSSSSNVRDITEAREIMKEMDESRIPVNPSAAFTGTGDSSK